MRPGQVLAVLVIAGAAAFGATSLSRGDSAGNDQPSQPGSAITPEHARSILYRLHQEALRLGLDKPLPVPGAPAAGDELGVYAAQCEQATGISIPDFSCLDGEDIPGQRKFSMGARSGCQAPNVLNHECDQGAHFQVLRGRTADAVAVAHCRKVGLPANQPRGQDFFNDIAIVQYNKRNGAVCFYQALSNLPGSNIPSPRRGASAPWRDGQPHWFTPTHTEKIGCTGCHDNGGFVRSPYIINTKIHKLPSDADGFDNRTIPLRYVGAAFSQTRSWSIQTSNAPGDQGINCTQCHRLAVSNQTRVVQGDKIGSALSFAVISTAKSQAEKLPHASGSPIWMRPGQVFYNPAAEATAQRFRNCAQFFVESNFRVAPQGCTATPLGAPFLFLPNNVPRP